MLSDRIQVQAAAGFVVLTLMVSSSPVWATELSGAIRECDAPSFTPVAGVLVRAFDEDLGSDDDLMGEARTDVNGRYKLVYEDIDWDLRVPLTHHERPDIYIEVYDRVRGREIKINRKSRLARDNPPHSNPVINDCVPAHGEIDYTVPAPAPVPEYGTLHVLAYNIYLRPESVLMFSDGQSLRVPLIAAEILRDNYDVIVFNEAFDDSLRPVLRQQLAAVYPYAARVPESSSPFKGDSGVMILSRWPIENGEGKGEYRLFDRCLGKDCWAEKGVAYIQINKNGIRYHVFGAHLQADPPTGRAPIGVRQSQLRTIRQFIDDKKIPSTDAVIIAGDLNIDMYAPGRSEYTQMLQILGAVHPEVRGHPYSFDERLNDLGSDRNRTALLDYVLYSAKHRQPLLFSLFGGADPSFNRVMFYRADQAWQQWDVRMGMALWDISDHYPIFGRLVFSWAEMEAKDISLHCPD